MDETVIRLLTPADAEQFRSLRLAALEQSPESFGADFAEERQLSPEGWSSRIPSTESNDFIYGAFNGDALVGMSGFYRMPREKTKHKGMIWGVYVAESARGLGLGRRLVEACLKLARQQSGIELVQLCVTESSQAARALYAKLGFKEYGIEPMALRVNNRLISEVHMWMPFCGIGE